MISACGWPFFTMNVSAAWSQAGGADSKAAKRAKVGFMSRL
jgi:hypothetical protein